MDIYQSLKQHNLLDYVHMCGCCDMELLKYYEQNDIIEELEKNYAAVAEEMYALHDMSELQEEEIIEPEIEEQKVIKTDEKSMEGDEELEEMEEDEEEMEGIEEFDLMSKKTEKAPAIKKKPREIEYVEGLDELLASIRKTGVLHRKDKELLLAGINNKHTSTAVIEYILLDEPYFTSSSVSEGDPGGMDIESIGTKKTVTTESAHESDEELISDDFPVDRFGYNKAFRKKWHLPPDDVPVYYPNECNLYREKLPIKEQRFKKKQYDRKEFQSYTHDKTFYKVFKEIFNKKKFIEEEKDWEQMMNRTPYYRRTKEDIKGEDSEIEKLDMEEVNSVQGTVQEIAEEQEAPSSKVPVEERKENEEIVEFEKETEFQADDVFSRMEDEELHIMKQADDDQTVGGTDVSDSVTEINGIKEEIEELPEHEEHSEPEVEEVHEEKIKSKTIDKPDEQSSAEKLLNKANHLKKDLYKYLLDGMIHEVSPHLECHGQHSEYKKVHRDLITKKEHTKLLCIPPGDIALAYEQILIDRAKKRTAERSERWYPHNTTGLGCGKKRIFYPFSEKCLQYEYIHNFTTKTGEPLKEEIFSQINNNEKN